MLPWFGGARAPWWRDGARGAMVGLALDHRLGDVARGVVEAVAWDVMRCLETAAVSGAFDGLVLGGGRGHRGLVDRDPDGCDGLGRHPAPLG